MRLFLVLIIFPITSSTILDFPLPDLNELNPVRIAQLFQQFIESFEKQYASPFVQSQALKAFGDNLKRILQLNLNSKGKSVEFGINQYSDLTDEEFAERVLMRDVQDEQEEASYSSVDQSNTSFTNFQSATSFDWRTRNNIVGPVRDQGNCGCCWAFAAAAVAQSAHAIKSGKLIQPSEQQLCDCGMKATWPGCNGGNVGWALDYVKKHGVSLESAYMEYDDTRASRSCTCADRNKPNDIKLTSFQQVFPITVAKMEQAIVSIGPIAASMRNGASFRHYKSGIFDDNDCDDPKQYLGGHVMTVVGYSAENDTAYWIVKNSWGTSYGEDGYVRFAKGKNLCSIESRGVYHATA